jgi:hypothetical protein
MDWREYRQHLREEWEFHCRHPELFLVWGVIVGWPIYLFFRG